MKRNEIVFREKLMFLLMMMMMMMMLMMRGKTPEYDNLIYLYDDDDADYDDI